MKLTKKEEHNFNNWYTKSNDYWNFSYRVSEKDRMARTIHFLHKYLKGSNKTALDIGCGNAIFTNEIAKVCENVIAMDISEVVIAEAKKKEG
jgi:2-polyprenyl-3-methyl-5-hydroxy-6-metoxy-1,4-benzoquinol methylase